MSPAQQTQLHGQGTRQEAPVLLGHGPLGNCPPPPSAAPWAPLGRGEHRRASRASALASDHPESGHPGGRTRRWPLVSWVWGVRGLGARAGQRGPGRPQTPEKRSECGSITHCGSQAGYGPPASSSPSGGRHSRPTALAAASAHRQQRARVIRSQGLGRSAPVPKCMSKRCVSLKPSVTRDSWYPKPLPFWKCSPLFFQTSPQA